MSRVVAVVQARMGSSRLPGKVLRPLPCSAGDQLTVLDWVMIRLRAAQRVGEVVVATSTDPADDELVRFCEEHEYLVERGSLHDVLSRFVFASEQHNAQTVVRVTGDCPLIAPEVVDQLVDTHLAERNEFTANRLPPPHHRTWPVGLDVEVASMSALKRAHAEATEPAHREHVMPYLYLEPGRFRSTIVECRSDLGHVRWTIDTSADLKAVRSLVAKDGIGPETGWERLYQVWSADPELRLLNSGVSQKAYDQVDERSMDLWDNGSSGVKHD